MNTKYYIADEDGFEFRIFNCQEMANEFIKLRPDCKISRSYVQKPETYQELLSKHGEAPF